MALSILTWNMDHWKRTREQREGAWDYLSRNVSADILLLQECAPPMQDNGPFRVLYRRLDDKKSWGSAVATRGLPLDEVPFRNGNPGAVIAADVGLLNGLVLTVVSLYGRFDEDSYVTTGLHRVLSDLTPLLWTERNRRLFIVAGDYNASTQWDERYPNQDPSHQIFFDRLEDLSLVDCTRRHFKQHRQTHRHSGSDFPWQNDYIHASGRLAEKMVRCEVLDDERVRGLSDHNPVVATFDV